MTEIDEIEPNAVLVLTTFNSMSECTDFGLKSALVRYLAGYIDRNCATLESATLVK
jgi:hypothetical protein